MSRKYKNNKHEEEEEKDMDLEHEDNALSPTKSMESEDEYTSQMEDEECPQTISLQIEVIMSPMKHGKGKVQTHIDISSPSGSIYAHDLLMGSNTPRSPKGIPIQLCSSRYGLEITYGAKLASDITSKRASSRALNFFVMWMEHIFEEEALNHVWFIDRLWLSFVQTLPSKRAMQNYFGRVDLSNRMFTFFPIVDEYEMQLIILELIHRIEFSEKSF
ncbi:hypothetical protein GOP47_0008390 [Adiantum capillus-veneris]|uniref:Uncharacterized protein n=1 Tax=Adiantum capillus-veneris TaxID=13818 RepID=A0A9D4UYU5_ADICA|nr:hypothetical protein GOP47_0008390 [Adiantum capillus-veneris]